MTAPVAPPHSPPHSGPSGAPAPLRLLVVDDDPDCAEELAELLECYGFATSSATTAAEARAAATAHHPDAILLDLSLGQESGLDLAREWLATGTAPQIILVSGRRLSPAEQTSFAGLAPPLLEKPVDIPALLALLHPARPAT